MKHFFSSALLFSVLLASAVLARAGVSYDESPVFVFDTRDYTTGLAAESGTFAFDTRLVDGLQGAAESVGFTFDTRGTTLPPLFITGVLRDSLGVPVVGATIQIKRGAAIFWQGVSGAGGTFTPPSLSGVNYTVIVTKAGYLTSITNPGGATGGSLAMNLTLQPLPTPPTATTVNRSLTGTEVRQKTTSSDPDFPVLLRYDGSQFVTDMTGIDTSRMTVVITHGWVPKLFDRWFDVFGTALDWTRMLAGYIYNHHSGLSAPPNILVWDWRVKAHTYSVPTDAASEVGLDLGRRLQEVLGANYRQHVHFIGHSLGTIVNRYACELAHKSLTGNLSSENPSTGWDSTLTSPHVTLLDEAELGVFGSTTVVTSSALAFAAANLGTAILVGNVEANKDWKYPIPRNAWWVDNYISLAGLQHAEAVNICLPGKVLNSTNTLAALLDGHSYAHDWYRDSVNPAFVGAAPPAVGYLLSVEGGGTFPPTGTGLTNGSYWQENLNTADALDLAYIPSPLWNQANIALAASLSVATVQPLDALGQSVLDHYQASIQWAGNVGGTAIVKTGQVLTDAKEKAGLWFDAAWDNASDIVNSINFDTALNQGLTSAVFGLQLQSGTPAPAAAGGASNAAPTTPPQPPYAWVTVTVPTDAVQMAFDFTVTGDPGEDRIACAVNGQNLFTLPAKFAEDGEPMSTDMMDISAYAGQTIEVFFGLAGGTSTNCELAIDGLRFITVPVPKVAVARSGNSATVKWPAAASGWTLESSDTLAPGSWQTVPVDSGVSLDSGVATLLDPIFSLKKFYRLRRGP